MKERPLVVYRARIERDPERRYRWVDWRVTCGCGLRSYNTSWAAALRRTWAHLREEHTL